MAEGFNRKSFLNFEVYPKPHRPHKLVSTKLNQYIRALPAHFLHERPLGHFPITFLKENRIFINMTLAEILNIKIPEIIFEDAIIVH